jgi:predicted small secreted protein
MKKFRLSLLTLVLAGAALTSCNKKNTVDPIIDDNKDSNESLSDAFFEKVSYKGAFGTIDWANDWANFNPQNTTYGAATETLSGSITTNTTLDASKIYLISGFVYVEPGITLTIPAGTIIRGEKASKATLVVTRGAKLIAEGTALKPIVFTSNADAGNRAPGDWGGIVILGKAKNNINGGEGLIEGGFTEPKGNHGGSDDADNSGILKYVRVEFPGIAYQTNNEINGITFGSVGSGTTVDYVQVSYCGDDSFEWFGGTVNAKHLISLNNVDDAFDFDNGYSGKVQFALAKRDPKLADQAGQSNGIESDNSEKVFDSSPRTRPVISNMTIIGPVANAAALASVDAKHEYANLWRRGSKMILANSVFIGFKYGLGIRDKETGDALRDGTSLIKNNIFQSYVDGKDLVADGTNPSFESIDLLKAYFNVNNNVKLNESESATLLVNPFDATSPSFVLKAGSAAATGASF